MTEKLDREISRKIKKIESSELSLYQIRELNDNINNLMAEKKKLNNTGSKHEYQYFGRGNELPGALDKRTSNKQKVKQFDSKIDAFYYGYGVEYPDTEVDANINGPGHEIEEIGKVELPKDNKEWMSYLMGLKKKQLEKNYLD